MAHTSTNTFPKASCAFLWPCHSSRRWCRSPARRTRNALLRRQAAGHCDSGIPAETTPPPPPEPMCGLDSVTIVAEPSHNESHDSLSRTAETTSHAAESNSLKAMSDGVRYLCRQLYAATKTRERGVLQPATYQNPSVTVHSRFQSQPLSFSSNEDWEQTSPRGPPADLLLAKLHQLTSQNSHRGGGL